jgi:hypothetical protein
MTYDACSCHCEEQSDEAISERTVAELAKYGTIRTYVIHLCGRYIVQLLILGTAGTHGMS